MKRFDVVKNISLNGMGFKGYGMGSYAGKEVRVWNAYRGEVVDMMILKKRKGIIEGNSCTIHTGINERMLPIDNHFLSCSPWQSISWEEELRLKKELIKDQYKTCVSESYLQSFQLITNDIQYWYRNKMEFSFCEDEHNNLSLAFIERGYKTRRTPLISCVLAQSSLMACAQKILQIVIDASVPLCVLKSLIIRSNEKGEIIAGLFVTDSLWKFQLSVTDPSLKGFAVYYSDPHSPMSRPDELLYTQGVLELDQEICDASLTYGLHSFFQVNIPMIEKALDDTKEFTEEFSDIIDMYCGVGTLGVILSQKREKNVVFIEEHESSIAFVKRNCDQNEISDYKIIHERSENSLYSIPPDSCVLLDPPRCGLHKNVIKKLHLEKPKRIVYLSCNIETQTRDIQCLKESYDIVWCRAYNFFPRTPHIEGLCILDRKSVA